MKKFISFIFSLFFVIYSIIPTPVLAYNGLDNRAIDNAKKLYSVMNYLDIPDINIAGMLANYTAESFMDATSVEAVWDELYQVGSKKQQFNQQPTAFFESFVVPKWSEQGVSLVKEVYKASDGLYYPGIGLGAFTGENCKRFLMKAQEVGMNWYDFDFQLAYIISNQYRPGVVRNWKTPAVSLDESAYWFMENWEGYKREWSHFASKRLEYTPVFYEMITNEQWNTQVDEEYARRILQISDVIDGVSTFEEIEKQKKVDLVMDSLRQAVGQVKKIVKKKSV